MSLVVLSGWTASRFRVRSFFHERSQQSGTDSRNSGCFDFDGRRADSLGSRLSEIFEYGQRFQSGRSTATGLQNCFSPGRMGLDRARNHHVGERLYRNEITEADGFVLRICSSCDGRGDAAIFGLVRRHRHDSGISLDESLRRLVVSSSSGLAYGSRPGNSKIPSCTPNEQRDSAGNRFPICFIRRPVVSNRKIR